ncbi:MAG: N-6 DNA methylase [Planctomycetes bacterium]|nr:N-6 DNA methylase [Planctomycetota bacterium]
MNLEAAWDICNQKHVERHSHGGVFTPRPVALKLAAETFSRWPHKHAPDVLDPACGHGALLLAAIEWATANRAHWLKHWADGGLRGWELHEDVAVVCREALQTALAECPVETRDSLSSKDREVADVVLANPPWISFSGRHAQNISQERRAELSRQYRSFKGWPALHTAFAELCVLLTRQDGVTGLLVPQQMSDLAGYKTCREVIAETAKLECAIELGEGIFSGVTEPTGMFVFTKTPAGDIGQWRLDEHPDLLKPALRYSPLPAECFADPGVHTGNMSKLLIAKEPEPNSEPVYVGKNIQPFSLSEPDHWLRDIDAPEGKYFRVSKRERYEGADILIRQTAARPIAAKHDPVHLFRNSILACYVPDDHDIDFVLAILNSGTMAKIHQALHRDGRQKAFPQMKVSHLRALPMPSRVIGEKYNELAALSRCVQAGQQEFIKELDELIDSIFT